MGHPKRGRKPFTSVSLFHALALYYATQSSSSSASSSIPASSSAGQSSTTTTAAAQIAVDLHNDDRVTGSLVYVDEHNHFTLEAVDWYCAKQSRSFAVDRMEVAFRHIRSVSLLTLLPCPLEDLLRRVP
jgi:hypothetical protein